MAEVFQRRLELENRRYALTPSLPCHQPSLRAPVHAYAPDPGALLNVCARARSKRTPACLRTRPFTPVRLIHERTRCCKRSFLTPVSLVYFRNPKLSEEYKHFEPSDPFEPLNGKNIAISKPDSIPLPL